MVGKESINPSDVIAVRGCGRQRHFPNLTRGTQKDTVGCKSFKSKGPTIGVYEIKVTPGGIGDCQNIHCIFFEADESAVKLSIEVSE